MEVFSGCSQSNFQTLMNSVVLLPEVFLSLRKK